MMKPKKPIGPDGRVRPAPRATPVPDVHMHDGIIEINLDRPAQAPAGSGVSVREATDKMLVEELRCRGWFVVCTKTQRL